MDCNGGLSNSLDSICNGRKPVTALGGLRDSNRGDFRSQNSEETGLVLRGSKLRRGRPANWTFRTAGTWNSCAGIWWLHEAFGNFPLALLIGIN
ncbi:hypothetical protein MA16_Dca028040 [Dendrobium catenatum]|uniref:Uncharacterized protein n=1 Tax=Dendrobium catenatum TaxID=906689 RepID=A0A2I0V9W3_9ASPA|nr:hypothetical protein MA16_Dca028040 [Dendrobium catenatum]